MQALGILRGFSGLHIVGGDIVEIAPPFDPTTNTTQIAAQMLFEILCLTGDTFPQRRAACRILVGPGEI